MWIFELFLKLFFLPGTLVLQKIGVTVEEDGGVLRSFVNMCVWGFTAMVIAITLF